jgi:hypothetical protein
MAWNKTMLGPVLTSREQQSRGLHALPTTASVPVTCSDGRGQGVSHGGHVTRALLKSTPEADVEVELVHWSAWLCPLRHHLHFVKVNGEGAIVEADCGGEERGVGVHRHGDLGLASHGRGDLAETDAQDGLPERVGAGDNGREVCEDGVVVAVEQNEGRSQEKKNCEVEISGPHATFCHRRQHQAEEQAEGKRQQDAGVQAEEDLRGGRWHLRACEYKQKAVSKSGRRVHLVGRLQLQPAAGERDVVEKRDVLRRGVALHYETLGGGIERLLLGAILAIQHAELAARHSSRPRALLPRPSS